MGKLFLLTIILSCGCQAAWNPVSPSGDPREDFVLAETQRVSAYLRVNVKGILTDTVYKCVDPNINPCIAAGWYEDGKAYYYRPYLLTKDMKFGTELAIHEVCHAVEYNHNERHEQCVKSVPR